MAQTKIKFHNNNNCCLIWHRWRTEYDNGKTGYFYCKDCSARAFRQKEGGHQPVDMDWVTGQSDSLTVDGSLDDE